MDVLRVAWYRLAVTVRRRWGGYLGLVLIIGLTGGVALGAAAAARRTESSYPVFLASTNPSDLTVQYAGNYYAGMPPFAGAVARLPHSAVGIPLGIALGRWLWTAFARQIYAVPEPAVPVGSLLLLLALVLVNLVAAGPGWSAARTPAALALRAE